MALLQAKPPVDYNFQLGKFLLGNGAAEAND
jgi:hypothetical protein